MDLRCFKALPVRCKSFSLRFQAGSNPTLSAIFELTKTFISASVAVNCLLYLPASDLGLIHGPSLAMSWFASSGPQVPGS
jgi:hypothetical protein